MKKIKNIVIVMLISMMIIGCSGSKGENGSDANVSFESSVNVEVSLEELQTNDGTSNELDFNNSIVIVPTVTIQQKEEHLIFLLF